MVYSRKKRGGTVSKKRSRSSVSKTSSRVKTKRTRMSKENINSSPSSSPLKYIIYHEGGDVYRPFIIIELNTKIWITPNIAFYKTSGKSNDRFGGIYAGTWIPTSGMLPENGMVNGKDEEKGYICKMSTLNGVNNMFPELCDLVKRYIQQKYGETYEEITNDILSENHNPDNKIYLDHKRTFKKDVGQTYFTILSEYKEIYDLIGVYFAYGWQLYVSAKVGSGYWERNTSFRDYVMETLADNQSAVNIPPVDIIQNISVENIKSSNEDEVIAFLRNNQALATSEINDFVKNTRNSLCEQHYIYKYGFVKSLIDQQARKDASIARINQK